MDAREAFEKSQSPSRYEIYKEKKARIIKQFVSRENLQDTVFVHIKDCAEDGKKESNLADIAESCSLFIRLDLGKALRQAGRDVRGEAGRDVRGEAGREVIDEQIVFSPYGSGGFFYYECSSDDKAIIQDIAAKILLDAGYEVNKESGVVSWANPTIISKEERQQPQREQDQEDMRDIAAKILLDAGYEVNKESGAVSRANPTIISKEERQQPQREQVEQVEQVEQREQKQVDATSKQREENERLLNDPVYAAKQLQEWRRFTCGLFTVATISFFFGGFGVAVGIGFLFLALVSLRFSWSTALRQADATKWLKEHEKEKTKK